MHITDKKQSEHVDTGYGEHIYLLAGADVGNMQQHSVVLVEIEPGRSSKEHYHPDVEETYYIISGSAEIKLNGAVRALHPGELIAIEPEAHHKITNRSQDEMLVFMATCAGPWTKDCSVFLE